MRNATRINRLMPRCLKVGYFRLRGKRPWSKGYSAFKFSYIKKVINDQKIMGRFENSESLPKGYGYALDDRVIEYPWVLSRMPASDDANLLDAGSALNFSDILTFDGLKSKKISIVNLDPE